MTGTAPATLTRTASTTAEPSATATVAGTAETAGTAGRLSPELLQVVQAMVFDGLTARETGRMLGLPEGAGLD